MIYPVGSLRYTVWPAHKKGLFPNPNNRMQLTFDSPGQKRITAFCNPDPEDVSRQMSVQNFRSCWDKRKRVNVRVLSQADMKVLQKKLSEQGYRVGQIDGQFSSKTGAALYAHAGDQVSNGGFFISVCRFDGKEGAFSISCPPNA